MVSVTLFASAKMVLAREETHLSNPCDMLRHPSNVVSTSDAHSTVSCTTSSRAFAYFPIGALAILA